MDIRRSTTLVLRCQKIVDSSSVIYGDSANLDTGIVPEESRMAQTTA